MNLNRRALWLGGTLSLILLALSAMPVAWAMPEHRDRLQTIPTRTPRVPTPTNPPPPSPPTSAPPSQPPATTSPTVVLPVASTSDPSLTTESPTDVAAEEMTITTPTPSATVTATATVTPSATPISADPSATLTATKDAVALGRVTQTLAATATSDTAVATQTTDGHSTPHPEAPASSEVGDGGATGVNGFLVGGLLLVIFGAGALAVDRVKGQS